MAKKKLSAGMTKEKLVGFLNGDLRNELKHMLFYLYHASAVRGLHRAEIRELLLEEAASEMKHVQEFQDLIIGLGGVPVTTPANFNTFTAPEDILRYALVMEEEVVKNYTERMVDAQALGGPDGQWVEVFLEDQILHSRTDADNLRQMVAVHDLPKGKTNF